jgi:GNAT superfamily N-acetyltransferase
MLIRRANENDLEAGIKAVRSIYERNHSAFRWEIDKVRSVVEHFIENGVCFVAEIDGKAVGCLVGFVEEALYSSQSVFHGWFWYSEVPGVGKKLLEHVDNWRKDQGIEFFVMTSGNEVLRGFYEREGFELYETHYLRGRHGKG